MVLRCIDNMIVNACYKEMNYYYYIIKFSEINDC